MTLQPARTHESPLPRIDLPWPVFHPWRKAVAGAALGLTETEFNEILTGWGPVYVAALLRDQISRDPLQPARQRLEVAPGSPRSLSGSELRRFGRAVAQLKEELTVDPILERVVLTHVVIPAPELMPAGLVLGGSQVVAAPLLAKVQGVRRALDAARRLVREGSEVLERAAYVAVQASVDGLFGAPTGEPGLDTLAAILRRAWPWGRPGHDRVASPRLFRMRGQLMDGPYEDTGDATCVSLETGFPARWPTSRPAAPRFESRTRFVPSETHARAIVARLLVAASTHQRDEWLLKNRLVPSHSRTADIAQGIARISLPDLVAVMTADDLLWASRRVRLELEGPTSEEEVRERLVDAGRAAVTERVAVKQPGVDPGELTPPAGCVWILPDLRVTARVGFLDRHGPVLAPPVPTGRAVGSLAVERLRAAWWPFLAAGLERTARLLGRPDAADLALAGLAMALRGGHSAVGEILEFLEAELPYQLPVDPEHARESVAERLGGLSNGTRATDVLVELLSVALSGWCVGAASLDVPTGVVWTNGHAPAGYRRMALPGSHAGWLTWPEIRFVSEPVRFLSDLHDAAWPLPESFRRWGGCPYAEAPEDLVDAEALNEPLAAADAGIVEPPATVISAGSPEPVPVIEEPATPASDAGIRPWADSILSWLQDRTLGVE